MTEIFLLISLILFVWWWSVFLIVRVIVYCRYVWCFYIGFHVFCEWVGRLQARKTKRNSIKRDNSYRAWNSKNGNCPLDTNAHIIFSTPHTCYTYTNTTLSYCHLYQYYFCSYKRIPLKKYDFAYLLRLYSITFGSSSKSLLANVLDIDDDFRCNHSCPTFLQQPTYYRTVYRYTVMAKNIHMAWYSIRFFSLSLFPFFRNINRNLWQMIANPTLQRRGGWKYRHNHRYTHQSTVFTVVFRLVRIWISIDSERVALYHRSGMY